MLYVIATFTVKDGSADTIIEKSKAVIEATRREEGCISYELNHAVEDANTFTFVERWESRAHLDAHFKTDHLQAWRDVGADHVVSRKVEIINNGDVEVL